MANTSRVPTTGSWGDTSEILNNNFDAVNTELTALKYSTSLNIPLFSSVSEAKKKILSPNVGKAILIGNSLPAPVYTWDGKDWVSTGGQGGNAETSLSQYLTFKKISIIDE